MNKRRCRCELQIVVLIIVILLAGTACRVCNAQSQDHRPRADATVEASVRRLHGDCAPLAEDRHSLMSLDRKIAIFSVRNGGLSSAISGLRRVGIDVCFEAVITDYRWFIDADNVATIYSDRQLSLDMKDATVRDILTRLCESDQRYEWRPAADGRLVVLAPRDKSRLQFMIGPVKAKGHPLRLFKDAARGLSDVTFPVSTAGFEPPDVEVDLPRTSATELLNGLVVQNLGMTWSLSDALKVTQSDTITARSVAIEYPKSSPGRPINSGWVYKLKEDYVNGVPTVIVERSKFER